ncbi:glycine cleavage system aminomethyltransferase GcvT [Rhodospirillum rubrum]|uniref:aminomethyltransferase n=1 Tax=Rhodospirillum rubrum (strain ATCC 11170 / ATH 1.1.1 / DSM 467 / LMG 4362 / NCIMB 8255 / S1) TaxID=269796 RepID=Q2RPU9_RHORT|nr:glycine cleavage system aminomethyltransferase GcvT [Rhodospirillum rubrum]ABC23846.1 Glycine cleavage system T protein [Rhodospirillum rubrum ATCC 11170]MBK5955523.1 glycine cleavage system protein T [Rhodospirillum rubrum]QXG79794.1 glycine cleavage system aminomethyltransferase GcvT [Rhodospirillum rubrum]HAP98871.1 glycine cleavage system protein T [Rhodospirillum rubrum]HCF18223.1 glycine cleavage system protein T [Rhodospirillum rubrum]
MEPHLSDPTVSLLTTPLHALHLERGARMVPFAGYDMPVQYPMGVLAEHLHTRASAGLFDVSHMGQARLVGPQRIAALEALVPGDLEILKEGRQRYTVLTNDQGGILDDLMVTKRADDLFLVVNAACKDADLDHIEAHLAGFDARLERLPDTALLALQGPLAVSVLAGLDARAAEMGFMSGRWLSLCGVDCFVTRSGYTGEDGFEISVPAEAALDLAQTLIANEAVALIGLGARDSLRLEAGLCLYGSDIDTTTTPVEAGLSWIIGKRRRAEGGFPGASAIQQDLAQGPKRCRVGLRPEGKAPVRAHSAILGPQGEVVGEVTSGGFSPSLSAPIAMGMVPAELAAPGTAVSLVVRGKALPAHVVEMPFVAHRYHKA